MLTGINPLLHGDLLRVLDRMGHNDVLLVADAHYPSYGMGAPVLEAAATTPEVVDAVRTVLPIDYYAGASVTLMTPEPGTGEEVQEQLRAAVRTQRDDRVEWIDRFEFYERGREVFAVIRTTETRKYGCVMLRKGVVGDPEP